MVFPQVTYNLRLLRLIVIRQVIILADIVNLKMALLVTLAVRTVMLNV